MDSNKETDAKKWLEENRNFYHKAAITKIEKIVNA
jgi:hypothetical protein